MRLSIFSLKLLGIKGFGESIYQSEGKTDLDRDRCACIRSEAIRITVALLFPKYFKYITKMLKTQCIMHDVRKCNLKYLVENNLCFLWKLSRNK